MKQANTLSLGGNDRGTRKFQRWKKSLKIYGGIAERLRRSGKKRIDKWFVHVRIEE